MAAGGRLEVGIGGVEGGGVDTVDETLVHAGHVAEYGWLWKRKKDIPS